MSNHTELGELYLKQLRKLCFDLNIKMVWRLPLAVGTYHDLRALIPMSAMTSKKLYAALCCHTRSPEYLRCLRKGQIRLAPGGIKRNVVSQAEYDLAQEMLKQQEIKASRSKRIMAKIEAKRQAKATKAAVPTPTTHITSVITKKRRVYV
jgi:sRNA-binding protein